MNEFLMIPNNYVFSYNNRAFSLIVYLMACENKLKISKFEIDRFILDALGIKPRKGKEGIVNEVRRLVVELENDGTISVTNGEINSSSCIDVKLNIQYEIDKNENIIKWFKLDIENYLKILNCKGGLKKDVLLKLYCYILSRIIKRNDSIGNVNITGGNAEAFWCKQSDICDDIGISKTTLNTYLKKLNELGLVYYGNIGSFRKDSKIIKPHNVYAVKEEELKEGLKQSKYYWESNNK